MIFQTFPSNSFAINAFPYIKCYQNRFGMKFLKKITKLYQVTVAYVIFVQIGDEQDYIPISTLKYYIITLNTA